MKALFKKIAWFFSFLVRYTDELTLAFIAVFLYIAAGSTQTGWLYFIVSLIISVLLLGAVLPQLNIKGIKVWRELPSFCYEGETITLTLRVQNESGRRKNLISLREDSLDPLFFSSSGEAFPVLTLEKDEAPSVSTSLTCLRRGIVKLEGIRIRTSFPFGFFPAERHVNSSRWISILPVGPRIEMLSGVMTAINSAGWHISLSYAGTSHEFLGIREYEPGDSTRTIHWPSTAKLGRLMVKEFYRERLTTLIVVIDAVELSSLGEGKESALEYEIKVAAGIVECAGRQRIPLMLAASEGDEVHVLKNSRSLQALEFLAGIENRGRKSSSALLDEVFSRSAMRGHILLLQTEPAFDYEVIKKVLRTGSKIQVVFFQGFTFHRGSFPEGDYRKAREELSGLGVPVMSVNKGDNLEERLSQWSAGHAEAL
ncbi:MAG: DUF58 domain-containing protein [Candidatus Eremiobacteraeota bacterium]|nr:DUF58 domain-containing protein [Candidatus Eremiobacteraeota bacterium]